MAILCRPFVDVDAHGVSDDKWHQITIMVTMFVNEVGLHACDKWDSV